MIRALAIGAMVLCTHVVNAQSVDSLLIGNCDPAAAEAVLEGGNLLAAVNNNGQLFWGDYEIPKGSGTAALFNVNLWLGGRIAGEIREAGTRYGPFEFWPGPLDENGRAPSSCLAFDSIYEVDVDRDLRQPLGSPPSTNLIEWPASLGAPYIDVDGEDGYDPFAGDLPAMLGDHMLWWRMNDRGNVHESTRGLPIGVDVQVTAYSFDARNVTGNTSFFKYEITNRNSRTIEDMWFGQRLDGRIGAGAKHSATDTTLGMIYTYYTDNYNPDILGDALPAVGITLLSASHETNESYQRNTGIPKTGFTHSMVVWLWLQRELERKGDMYDWLSGNWPWFVVPPDTTRLTEGILGGAGEVNRVYSLGGVTEFMFPGDPVTQSYWSMNNIDDQGTEYIKQTNFMVGSYGPFDLAPGDTFETTVAIVWSLGDDRLHSVSRLRNDASYLLSNADRITSPRVVRPAVETDHLDLAMEVYPNPTDDVIHLRLRSPQPELATASLYDTLGREIRQLVTEPIQEGTSSWDLDIREVPAGVYVVRAQIGQALGFRTVIVL